MTFFDSSGARLRIDMDQERGKNSAELERETGDPPCSARAATRGLPTEEPFGLGAQLAQPVQGTKRDPRLEPRARPGGGASRSCTP